MLQSSWRRRHAPCYLVSLVVCINHVASPCQPYSTAIARDIVGRADPVTNDVHAYMHGLFVSGVCNIAMVRRRAYPCGAVCHMSSIHCMFIGCGPAHGRIVATKLQDVVYPYNQSIRRWGQGSHSQPSDLLFCIQLCHVCSECGVEV